MFTYYDLKSFFEGHNFKVVIAADGETRTLEEKNGQVIEKIPAGGVSVAFDPIAKASGAVYIARGKSEIEKKMGGTRVVVDGQNGKYTLKRVFFSQEDTDSYYYGFANQTLWPLCHVAFERPQFHKQWYEGFKKVNQKFAQSIKEEIKGKTFVWINDYQLSLVPKYLDNPKNCIIAMFWHIPWPTWEVFRILPYKKEIINSLLKCDFLAFHRGYQVRNFLETVRREFETRIDDETGKVYLNQNVTTVKNLPMGIDVDVIKALVYKGEEEAIVSKIVRKILGADATIIDHNGDVIKKKIIIGVDRLDYTKGLLLRLMALDRFFERNPQYLGLAVYIGVLAPSRESIPSYRDLKKEIKALAESINRKYEKGSWRPIYLVSAVCPREEVVNFYRAADVCLVTPLDDGMNLVSKEFVVASSFSKDPGMLVLSQFAGSAIDLTDALIVNPYNIDEVVGSIKRGLEMSQGEKVKRIKKMAEILDEKNIYEWAEEFVRNAVAAS